MANALYTKGKQHILAGDIDFDAHTIKVVGIDETTGAADVPVLATDDALDDIAVGARVVTSGALAGKSVTDGVFDATDLVLSSVTGALITSFTGYKDDGGVESTSYLIWNMDFGTGLPVTPNGGDITIQWDSGANKIFAL